MSIQTAITQGRRAAEALMVDACTIRRKTGETTDPNSGVITPTYSTIYTGKCQVQQASPTVQQTSAGEAELLMLSRVLKLPVLTSTGIRADDEAIIDAATEDPDLAGRVFVVRGEFAKSLATSRRLGIQEVTS